MKILIIDDEEDVRRIAYLSLVNVGGMEVEQASSGPEGIDKAMTFRPDAILLDVMMPGMDGSATLAELRNRPATASIPVIFVTAQAIPKEVGRLKELGARAVLTKPFNALTLSDDLRKVLL